MASYKKRGKTWTYTVELGKCPETGKRLQVSKGGFELKKHAQEAANEVERAIANNTYIKESDITFAEFAEEWLEEYSKTVKISTIKIRKESIVILKRYLGSQKIKNIALRDYQKMLNDLHKKYADNTISMFHITAKLIFGRAVEYGVISNDPTQYAKIIKKKVTVEDLEDTQLPKYLEKDELSRFLETAKQKLSHQDYVIYLTLAYTGMRRGELIALKWSDIDKNKNSIRIIKTCYLHRNRSQEYTLLTPKTKASIRDIVVDPIIITELKKHQFRQNEIKNRMGKLYHNHDFVFSSIRNPGFPYNTGTIEQKMKRILKSVGLSTSLSPHSLRHTHTSLLAEAGVGLTEIMERLGHENDSITRKIYLHVTKTKRVEAADKFSSLMKSVDKM